MDSRLRCARGVLRLTTIAVLALALCSCSLFSKKRQLEDVAKDWSMTIRASQIIPVYPLTEDLQPGDVFLVQVPVAEQQKQYEEDGFLPLDNHLLRLQPDGYPAFYSHSFLKAVDGANKPVLPYDWLTGSAGAKAWSAAPNVSFPSYSFSVQRGGGFNLAVPVQGVPIGLSLMGGDAAQGSILITDAKSYGIDTISLASVVDDWARNHRDFLAQYGPQGKSQNYLRIVSRVYLTGRVNISMSSSKSGSGGLSAGAPKPVDVFSPSTDPSVQKRVLGDYETNLKTLNQALDDGLKVSAAGGLMPGGTVKVVAASSNSVTLAETFTKPLAIGYLGFDMAIDSDGYLGAPVPTAAILTRGAVSQNIANVRGANLNKVFHTLTKASASADKNAGQAKKYVSDLNGLALRVLPDVEPCDVYHLPGPGKSMAVDPAAGSPIRTDANSFSRLIAYRERLNASTALLGDALNDKKMTGDGAADPGKKAEAKKWQDALDCENGALNEVNEQLQLRAGLLYKARVFATQLEFGE